MGRTIEWRHQWARERSFYPVLRMNSFKRKYKSYVHKNPRKRLFHVWPIAKYIVNFLSYSALFMSVNLLDITVQNNISYLAVGRCLLCVWPHFLHGWSIFSSVLTVSFPFESVFLPNRWPIFSFRLNLLFQCYN